VRRFWRRGGEDLESRLERRREPARPEYVNQLARELRSTGRRRLAPVRLLLAAALTLMMLVAVASVGGVASGALVRDHVVAVAKSVNKKVTAKRGSSWRYADDDDDDNGGGGGGGDDDDDDGGDDDDDDGDDDEYEEERRECLRAVNQARRSFQATQRQEHREFHQTRPSSSAHRAFHNQEKAEDRAFKQTQQNARDECREIGGGGGDDDDDD
jgi:hypothetical protein